MKYLEPVLPCAHGNVILSYGIPPAKDRVDIVCDGPNGQFVLRIGMLEFMNFFNRMSNIAAAAARDGAPPKPGEVSAGKLGNFGVGEVTTQEGTLLVLDPGTLGQIGYLMPHKMAKELGAALVRQAVGAMKGDSPPIIAQPPRKLILNGNKH